MNEKNRLLGSSGFFVPGTFKADDDFYENISSFR